MAIGMVPEQKRAKLNNSEAEKIWPETHLSVLAPSLLARPLLLWAAAFCDQPIVMSDVEAYEVAHGTPFDWNLKEVSEALAQSLQR